MKKINKVLNCIQTVFLKTVTTIADYYKEIHVKRPRHPAFHIGRHEENMQTIKKVQKPLKHELYSISLFNLAEGESGLQIDNQKIKLRLFIITPFKKINWDIRNKKFKGIYIIFDRVFIRSYALWENFLVHFPYFNSGHPVTSDISDDLIFEISRYFEKIHALYHSEGETDFELIKGYVHIVFMLIGKAFDSPVPAPVALLGNDKIRARFEALLQDTLERSSSIPDLRKPSFYAAALHIHTNHLNSVVKQITGKTTSAFIQLHIIHHAKLLLLHQDITIKDLAARYHFSDPTHFIAFFKKQTGQTPKQYKIANTVMS